MFYFKTAHTLLHEPGFFGTASENVPLRIVAYLAAQDRLLTPSSVTKPQHGGAPVAERRPRPRMRTRPSSKPALKRTPVRLKRTTQAWPTEGP